MENLLELITIGKYILITITGIGVILLGLGIYQRRKELITPGAYMIILAIVLATCGYFIYEATVDKAQQIIYDTYNQYQ
jgi:membrane-associated PAP2 superfamily phosphatase